MAEDPYLDPNKATEKEESRFHVYVVPERKPRSQTAGKGDVTPHINNYRSAGNGTENNTETSVYPDEHHFSPEETVKEDNKFGWIEGVLIRNMLSIWGVMLFLRISWVVALAGIWQTLIIILISMLITLATASSMSAIATNGEIGGGGTYYVMSRILGPEWGGSIGLIFAFANAINASLNVVGFSQTLQHVLLVYGGYIIVDGGVNDTRIIGSIVMLLVWGLCGLGAKYESKSQVFLLVVLLVALGNFVVGSILGPGDSEEKRYQGFLGYDLDLYAENWSSSYISLGGTMQDFFSIFAVYFPASIGILSGANVSANLKNPSKAIPRGTILAIIITTFSYVLVAVICAGTTERTATGCPPEFDVYQFFNNSSCIPVEETYGSYYDYQLMTLISAYGPLNYAGCFAATLSSALASFISCPQLLLVIGDDKIYPFWIIGWMTKGYGKAKEPYLVYLFTFIVALTFVLIGNLDTVALLISNFFLATFALMNYSTFHVSLVKPTGWRPTFKYYNMWLSLLTAILCVVAMFLISWLVGIITIAVVAVFYLAVLYGKPKKVNWGSSNQAKTYNEALSRAQQLIYIDEHVKNYRPQVLVMTGHLSHRPALLDMAYLICKKRSMLVCGNIVQDVQTIEDRSKMLTDGYKNLRSRKIRGFYAIVDKMNLQSGVSAMLSLVGLGKMKPNILLLGYKNDWRSCGDDSLQQYYEAIKTGFDSKVGVAILRVTDGLDYSGILSNFGKNTVTSKYSTKNEFTPDVSIFSQSINVETINSSADLTLNYYSSFPSTEKIMNPTQTTITMTSKAKKTLTQLRDYDGNPLSEAMAQNILIFQREQRKTIDVWWLHDDGGLTLLLPHIINTRSNWSSCKLRVFCTTPSGDKVELERERMVALMGKLRIRYSNLVVITEESTRSPDEYTIMWFDSLLRRFVNEEMDSRQELIEEIKHLQEKTNRFLRLRELLLAHSTDSSLIVMTLPVPRKEPVTTPLYMAWLETLTANMPPFLLVRGNQTSVLTVDS